MTTHGSLPVSSASSLAEIRTSVMAASPVFGGWGSKTSHVRQHLSQLLGGGRNDGNEIGFARPALGGVALQVTARAAMEHGGMRCGDAGLTRTQPKRYD